ncbi:MAG: hypothetical protein WD512_01365 [Candidatus Paceibacterota bacterium]
MPKFKLRKIEQVQGRNTYYKLIKDGKCEFEEFCTEMSQPDKYESELKKIFSYMELAANQQPLPKTKFKDITPKKATAKEHEFKSKHLRVYAFQQKSTGKIIVCGGTKSSQKSDIKHFREVKEQYFNYIGE